jgi:aldehyde dehydrogenase (NAD+)
MEISALLQSLRIASHNPGVWIGHRGFGSGETIVSYSPVDGQAIASFSTATTEEYNEAVAAAEEAQRHWRKIPAPKRGEIIRQFGDALRNHKQALGTLVSYEMGKSLQEGLGEVQEMIDICDFAVGLSRQLYGMTTHSERPEHRMYEQYHPLGVVGIISAFNFPVAVWSWNSALAWICGNTCVWKPSEKSALCSIACQHIWNDVAAANNLPEGLSVVVNGRADIGQSLAHDVRIPLVSATGSTRMGKAVAVSVAQRLGKSLLELGGNNAVIITPSADLQTVLPALVFGAIGTCGQRCTSTRRLIIHRSVYATVCDTLVKAYGQLRIGNPLDASNHMGPLTDNDAVHMYLDALDQVEKQGGKFLLRGEKLSGTGYESGCYVSPSIAEASNDMDIVQHETFAPILYVMPYDTLEEAILLQNGVVQGLSSAIMTQHIQESERFLSAEGSDCGIANVNIGTSGAEIGGAFGGEKETGGGRESGSDAWKAYMRRQTNTINYGNTLPLAQGIQFNL